MKILFLLLISNLYLIENVTSSTGAPMIVLKNRQYVNISTDFDVYLETPFVEAEDLIAKNGDLIEIHRNLFSHWGVYVGDGYIIHFTGPFEWKKFVYFKDKLKDVTKGSLCRVNNLEKEAIVRGLTARDVHIVLRIAYSKVGQFSEYNLLQNNCQTFVTECRYGIGFSNGPERILASNWSESWEWVVDNFLSFLAFLSDPSLQQKYLKRYQFN